jgi:membrane-associated phospholipid phosphatase
MTARLHFSPHRHGLISACVLATLFVVVYGGSLALTASRTDVGRLYFDWELSIPVVPAMIVPYFSIYFLFFASFFICRNVEERRTLSLQIAVSLLAAGTCYLLFPLEFGAERPPIDGVFGLMFRLLEATDRPYNLAPSLHVSTAVILGNLFASKAGGLTRAAVTTWFSLIAIATIFTWQHHLVDAIGGALLGAAALRVKPHVLGEAVSRLVVRPGVTSPRPCP